MIDPMLLSRLLEQARRSPEFLLLWDPAQDTFTQDAGGGLVVRRARAGGWVAGGFIPGYSRRDKEALRRTFGLDFTVVKRSFAPHPAWPGLMTARLRHTEQHPYHHS